MPSGLDSLLSALRLEFVPELRKLGFKGSGKNFRRIRGETINAINIQGSSTGARFYVNLGLHFTFLPPGHAMKPIPTDKFKEIDCLFRWRLDSPDSRSGNWAYGDNPEDSASIAAALLTTYLRDAEPVYERFRSAAAFAEAIPIEMVLARQLNIKPLPWSYVSIVLTLARVHRYLKNWNMCREFAVLGLSNSDSADWRRPEFEQLAQLN